MIDTLTQRHLLPIVTRAALLRRIGRVDLDELSASFFRFARQLREKGRPRCIMNAFCQAMVMGHTLHLQVFHADDTETVNDLSTFLMGKVLTPESDTLVNSCDHFAMLAPLFGAFDKCGVLTLHTSQGLLFLTEKPGVLNLFCSGESSKGFQSDVNPHVSRGFGQAERVAFCREGDVPFAGRGTMDGTGFECASQRSVRDHLERANLREAHPISMSHAEARLREGEGVVSLLPTETGKPWIVSVFTEAAEEGFEGEVNAHRHVLKDLRVDGGERRAFGFESPKGGLLLVEREAFSFLCIRSFPLFKQVVIEPTALIKRFVEPVNLLLSGIHTVLKGFTHAWIIAHMRTDVKWQVATQPRCPKQGTPLSSPWINRRGFQRRRLVNISRRGGSGEGAERGPLWSPVGGVIPSHA